MKRQVRRHKALPTMGWREWIQLPELGQFLIKAKVDTGARSSSLHAYDLEIFDREGVEWVRFVVHPLQRDTEVTVECEAPLLERRWVRSSTGERQLRPVIRTDVLLAGRPWPIDLTLTSRDVMGFRMLLGREAIRRRFLVDAGRSYLLSRRLRRRGWRRQLDAVTESSDRPDATPRPPNASSDAPRIDQDELAGPDSRRRGT